MVVFSSSDVLFGGRGGYSALTRYSCQLAGKLGGVSLDNGDAETGSKRNIRQIIHVRTSQ